MIIVGCDVESTGLRGSEVVEGGVVVMDSTNKFLLSLHSDILKVGEWSNEAEKVHGISKAYSDIGRDKVDMWDLVKHYKPQAVVAHNAEFDKSMFSRYWPEFLNLPWICSQRDLPHKSVVNNVTSLRLNHIASDYGITNSYPHRAVFDALTSCLMACEHKLDELVNPNIKKYNLAVRHKGKIDFKSKNFLSVKKFLKSNGFTWQDPIWSNYRATEELYNKIKKITEVSNWVVEVK